MRYLLLISISLICITGQLYGQEVNENNGQTSIQKEDNYELIKLLNDLTHLKRYRTNELMLTVFETHNPHGSAGFNSGEVTSNILIAVSEYDELPEQSLFRINNLFAPELKNFDDSNPTAPTLSIQHIVNGRTQELKVRLSINSIQEL